MAGEESARSPSHAPAPGSRLPATGWPAGLLVSGARQVWATRRLAMTCAAWLRRHESSACSRTESLTSMSDRLAGLVPCPRSVRPLHGSLLLTAPVVVAGGHDGGPAQEPARAAAAVSRVLG